MAPSNMRRQLTWTVIPSGWVENVGSEPTAYFSILITPRLLGPEAGRLTVAQFGMQAWPDRLAAATLKILRAAEEIPAQVRPYITEDRQEIVFSRAQRQAAWQAFFPGDKLVRPYRRTSYTSRTVSDFPASEAAGTVRSAYGDSAHMLAVFDDKASHLAEQRTAELQRIAERWQEGLFPEEGSASTESPLLKAYKFYQRESPGFTAIETLEGAAPPELDFHDVVARLADHPVLLRLLGLLIDFSVPTARLAGTAAKELRVVPRWPNPDSPAGWANAAHDDLSPRTAFTLSGSRFLPFSPSPPDGMLPLAGVRPAGEGGASSSNARFEVMPFDVDGAALRMVSVARSDRVQPSSDDLPNLPALRSTGFGLVEKSRKAQHQNRVSRADDRATPAGLLGSPLQVDNLSAGYRVDIYDSSQWRPVCQRRVWYTVGGAQIGPSAGVLEESLIRADSLTTGAGANDTVYLHQTIVSWNGWNMVVPRPERVPPSLAETGLVTAEAPPFTVKVDVDPGSLPRLKFGRAYRLRVRLADVAGGGLRMSQVGATEQQTDEFLHRRYDPTPSPVFAPTRAYVDGERQDLLLIRSDRGVSPAAYAAANQYPAFDLRYFFAPAGSLELTLQYDKLDSAMGPANAGEATRLFEVAKRADRDLGVLGHLDPTNTYFIVQEGPAQAPWLPDPGTNRISFLVRSRPVDPRTGVPGETSGFYEESENAPPLSYRWKGTWPILQPVGLRTASADSGCTASYDYDLHMLKIALGPAEQVTLDAVSCPPFNDVPELGVTHWAVAAGNPGQEQQIKDYILHGKNPMVTPPRTITLVHAVQHPLRDPSGRFVPKRTADDTSVVLGTRDAGVDVFEIDIPSTGRIDVRASWTDMEDTLPGNPASKTKDSAVGSYDVEHQPLYKALPEIRQEFGDTRRRQVKYTVSAVSRFRDFFEKKTAAAPRACTVDGTLQIADIPSTARAPAPALRYLMPTFSWNRVGEGTSDIKSIRKGGRLRAFLERPWYVSGFGEMLAVIAWPQPGLTPFSNTLPYLSVAGRDPIWNTASPPGILTSAHFNSGESVAERLSEGGQNISAVLHRVTFDEEVGCWYADIDLSPLTDLSYFPFVRLGLARYQGNTVARVERLSPPIVSDPIQIFPSRELTIHRSAGRANVTVNGLRSDAARPTSIQAELQVFEGNSAQAADALIGRSGWRVIARKAGSLGSSLDLDIPEAGSRQMRIAVTEAESYAAEGAPSGTTTSRVVYADIVPL